ncbi:MAG: type 1 glutamine amidotransferase [Kiritimatiellia bacterium]|jgi:type 1 glutamine amidotransferase
MKNRFIYCLCLIPGLLLAGEFRPLFDGKTLEGWSAPDMRYWSIEDGAITATSSDAIPCKQNQFLVWQLGELDDFELKLKFRIQGQPNANSGIQIRSHIAEDGHASGYQCDMDRAGQWLGALYDEHTSRRLLAGRGQKTTLDDAGARTSEQIADAKTLLEKIDLEGWNEYHIIAQGSHITLKINGHTTAEVIDNQTSERDLQGKLALQIHSGPPMKVQFKDIELKRTKLTDRKKLVLVAGAPSHRSGDHEHNAGIKLLAKRLKSVDAVIAANYHDRGWPKDPTAFDNVDGIVMYSDGGGGHPFIPHLKTIDALMDKGVGLMCMHYAVEVPAGEPGEHWKKWIGGYYESGWSINPHWLLKDTRLADKPMTAGVKPWQATDEWYYNMRFRKDESQIIRILQARPNNEDRSGSTSSPRGPKEHVVKASGRMETVMWAVEREDGGRGVGFTGGHFHKNWANDQQRNLILNTMLWMAGADVPEGGLKSAAVDVEEINQNLDAKKKMATITLTEEH